MACRKPIRILIMEDDAGQARLAQRMLERTGYAVAVAGDGDTGLALALTGAYDVLMVDHQMPGTGGLEVLRTLAVRGALPPTIMVTGHSDEAIAVEAMKLGAGDYVVKDVEGDCGTGLGLAIRQQILDSHQGTMCLTSTPGRGTTVIIEFPQADPTDFAPLPFR